eukprot:m.18863 g.18863  ORF g.18863 m.18863 type:complete len:153 (-) comp5806_c0_seq1:196-654(-)
MSLERQYSSVRHTYEELDDQCEALKEQMRQTLFEWTHKVQVLSSRLSKAQDQLPEGARQGEGRKKRQTFQQKQSTESKIDNIGRSVEVMATALGVKLATRAICYAPRRGGGAGQLCETTLVGHTPEDLDSQIGKHLSDSPDCTGGHLLYPTS